jgi:hypothetical protein
MTNHEKIIELNKIWYPLITSSHHKSRDCHFYIIIDHHFGEKVSYTVEHKGYIVHDYDDTEWNTLKEAELELIKLLGDSIISEADWYLNLPKPETMGCYDEHPKYDREDLEEIITRVMLIIRE